MLAFDLFYLWLAAIVVVIIAFIVRAVRLTKASLTAASRHVDLTNQDVARSLVEQIRGGELLCPRCGHEAFALLGKVYRYKCDSCDSEFEGTGPHPRFVSVINCSGRRG